MDAKVEAAAESLEITLEDWPTAQAVLTLLAERRDWPKVERAHRLLLAQTPIAPARELTLSRGLASVCRDHLRQDDAATEIYRGLIARPNPEVVDFLELATLHERGRRLVEAIDVMNACLLVAPDRLEPYKRIFELSALIGDVDGAWRAAAALVMLECLEVEYMNFYADHFSTHDLRVIGALASDYSAVRPPGEDLLLSEVFRLLSVAIPKPPRVGKTDTWEKLYIASGQTISSFYPQYELATEPLEKVECLFLAGASLVSGEVTIPPAKAATVTLLRSTLERELKEKDELRSVLVELAKNRPPPDIAKWWRDARIARATAALLFVGNPKLVDDFFKGERSVLVGAMAAFASARFGRLRAELHLGLTPPAT